MGTRVWSGEDADLTTGDVSPDGRYFTDIEWGSGDLDIVDLETGQARHLTGQGYDAGGYAWASAFSTDGRRIAVAWYVDRYDSHDLRVMNLDGTGSRVLIPAAAGHFYVDPVDWSPTDEEILVGVRNANRTWQLELVSVRDGSRRIVTRLGWQTPGGGHDQAYPDAKLSRDGRFVAYDYPPAGGDHTRDVFAVDVSSGETTALVTGPGSDRLLGWLPDGSGILFYSDRSGTPAVWRLGVQNGRASGDPTLVRAGVRGLIPMGFTTRGYAYGVAAESERVHTVAIDSTTGTVREPSRAVADPAWRKSYAADWSPDGSRLAYVTHDPFPDPVETLLIVSEKGDVVSRIPLTPAVHSSNGTLRWVSEDRILLFGYEQGHEGIHAVDLRSGTVGPIPTPQSVGRAALKWFEAGPKGDTLYFVAPPKPGSRDNELLAFVPATGEHRVLGTARVISNSMAVSPDGSALAFLARADAGGLEVRLMSTRTGSVRALQRVPAGRMSAPLAWSPDGSRLIVELTDDTGTPALWSLSISGGEPVRVLAPCCRENDVRLDRQGRKIAFAAGVDRGEIWFLPLALTASSAPASASVERMYVFICGEIAIRDISHWSPGVNAGRPFEFSNNCYLIRHAKGWMLWDSGYSDAVAARPEGVEAPSGLNVGRMPRTLTSQLSEIGLTPSHITHLAFSHLHGDHVGNANLLSAATLYMQETEYDAAFGPDPARFSFNLTAYERLRANPVVKLRGDHDVFGDGSVTIISTPGHTPGHQSLLVRLPRRGPVILSGDLVHFQDNWDHRRVPAFNFDREQSLASMQKVADLLASQKAELWINHDKAHSARIPKSPQYLE